MGDNSSFTEVRRKQIVTLHGEGHTERDIADELLCSKIAMNNTIVKINADCTFHDKERSGRPKETTPMEDHSVGQIVMRSRKEKQYFSILF